MSICVWVCVLYKSGLSAGLSEDITLQTTGVNAIQFMDFVYKVVTIDEVPQSDLFPFIQEQYL